MEILTGKKAVAKVVFKLTLDWATDDERDNESLLFDCKEDAVDEFNAQLNKIKTNKSSWEYDALQEAANEHDYLNRFSLDFNHLLNHPNSSILLKSFVLYQDGYEDTEHTYLTLRAVCILEH